MLKREIDSVTHSLKDSKVNVKSIIDEEIKSSMRKRFPNMRYREIIRVYGDRINALKQSLYRDYCNETNFMISNLNLLKQEV